VSNRYPTDLHVLWCADLARLEVDQSLPTSRRDRLFDQVWSAYADSSRRYHSTDHVTAVVRRVTELATATATAEFHFPIDVSELRMAAWFHDVVYDVTKHDNEAQSAAYASAELTELGVPAQSAERVADLVRMTAHHQPADEVQSVLSDADLWTLGGSADDYFAYGSLIRVEYAHVNDADWKAGRGAFIQRFLQRPHIFHTPTGRTQRELQARGNLTEELARLNE
jgi:predicted metal-dependent HD superfamily phosphohydrolase